MKEYYIKTKEGNIPVTEEIYYAYFKPKWQERYKAKKRSKKEISYDVLNEVGVSVELKMTALVKPLDEEVVTKIMIGKMKQCLSRLNKDELFLIIELFFNGKTIREISTLLSIPKTSVQRQKEKILKKLFVYLNKAK